MTSDNRQAFEAFAPMAKDRCIEVVRDESGALASAARQGVGAEVPRYPGWTVGDLLVHTGVIHDWVERIVRERASDRPGRIEPPEWKGDAEKLADWFLEGASKLADTLSAADPSTEVWSFAGEGRVSFWLRRMAHETATHRWDAESALGTPRPFPDDLAASGITESLEMHLPDGDPELSGSGELVELAPLGGREGSVFLLLDGGRISSAAPARQAGDPEHLDATVATVRGTFTDLWLLLTGRGFRGGLAVTGDRSVFDRMTAAIGRVRVPSRP